jgi:hypothetical protein
MSDASLRIKNLSISLEALSRINNEGSGGLYNWISQALYKELDELEKEQKPDPKPALSAALIPDDDIPF